VIIANFAALQVDDHGLGRLLGQAMGVIPHVGQVEVTVALVRDRQGKHMVFEGGVIFPKGDPRGTTKLFCLFKKGFDKGSVKVKIVTIYEGGLLDFWPRLLGLDDQLPFGPRVQYFVLQHPEGFVLDAQIPGRFVEGPNGTGFVQDKLEHALPQKAHVFVFRSQEAIEQDVEAPRHFQHGEVPGRREAVDLRMDDALLEDQPLVWVDDRVAHAVDAEDRGFDFGQLGSQVHFTQRADALEERDQVGLGEVPL